MPEAADGEIGRFGRRGGNQAFIERLSERSRKFFSSIEPELAGEIGGSNMLVPSDSEAR